MSAPRRRVLAVFDPATGSADAIEAVAVLAARLGAELAGVWAQDERLLRLAELPFVRGIVPEAGAPEALVSRTRAAEIRVLGASVRRRLGEAAQRHRVSWSFETAPGTLANGVAAASAPDDLIVVEGASRPLAGGGRLPSQARTTVERVNRPVMLLPPGTNVATGPVRAVREAGSDRSILAARELAARMGARLEEVAETSAPGTALRTWSGGVLVLAHTSRWLGQPDVWDLLAEVRCATWIVR